MPPSGVDYASEFLNGYAPEYVAFKKSNIRSVNLKFRQEAKRDAMTWKLTHGLTDDAIIEIR